MAASKRQSGTKRRSTHGVHCPRCASTSVVIVATRTRVLPGGPDGDRQLRRRQYCRCLRCKHRWPRTVRVREEVVE